MGLGQENSLRPTNAPVGPWEHGYATVNGVKLHYLTMGEGFPMVMLHGWPQTSYCWRKIMPAMAERFTVVAPDLRGFGDSDKPESGYEQRTLALDIVELMRSLGHERAVADRYLPREEEQIPHTDRGHIVSGGTGRWRQRQPALAQSLLNGHRTPPFPDSEHAMTPIIAVHAALMAIARLLCIDVMM